MRPLLLRGVLGVIAVAVLAGCTSTTEGRPIGPPGDASETAPPETSADDELPAYGAPEVEDPIDTAKFQENPCLSLTSEQSEQIFHLPATGRLYNAELGKACEWKNATTRGYAVVSFLDRDPRGLSGVYGANQQDLWAYFEPLTVEGQPAVARSAVERREEGNCTIVVGASDTIAFEVPVQLSPGNTNDSCAVAADVAGEVVKTMKAG